MKHLWTFALVLVLLTPFAVIYAQDDTPPVEPPPADYAEIADAYTEFSDPVIAEGAEVVDLLLSGDLETVYERFSTTMKEAVTLEQLEAGHTQITSAGTVGERVDYRVLSTAGTGTYVSVHPWMENQQIAIVVALSHIGEIDGLNLQPVPELPEDPAAGYQSDVTFRLPFEGLWFTFWGGSDAVHNYHVDAAPQRHAYDFVIWKDGATFTGDGTANTDYYAYGQTVLAPADGEVIIVVNDLPESLPQVETDANNPAGNHVVIEVAENEYLFIAHMQPGSILVEVGDMVTAGQLVGLAGNSGNTSEPHIHIHLQDQLEMFTYDEAGQINGLSEAIGLPLQFSNYLADSEPVEMGEPIGGQFVQNAE